MRKTFRHKTIYVDSSACVVLQVDQHNVVQVGLQDDKMTKNDEVKEEIM